MDPGDALEERTVRGHREIDTRAGEQVLAEEPDRRDCDARGNQRRTALAERRPHHVRRWRGRRRQPRHPQRADAHVIDQKIEQDHAGDANQQPSGKVTLRRLQLSGDEARGLPAAVGEQHRHQRRAEGVSPVDSAVGTAAAAAGAAQEAERHQHRDGPDLEDHEDALQVAARAHAQAVDRRQHAQRTDRDGAFASGHAAQIAEVACEGHRHGGHPSTLRHQEQSPGVEERHERVKRLAQVGVLAADGRPPRRELRVDEGADQREDAAHGPRAQRRAGGADLLRHHGGIHEDPGADDAAHHDHGGVEERQAAGERDVGHHGPRHHVTIACSNRRARSSSPAGRGESLVTRCCGSVPATSAGISAVV